MKPTNTHLIYILILLWVNHISGQQLVGLINQVKGKYYETEITCGVVSVKEVRPDEVSLYSKRLYSDNRKGQHRIIKLPDWQRTYVFNGDTTWVIMDNNQSYYINTDTMALLRFMENVDNISGLILTRQNKMSEEDSLSISEYKDSIQDIDKNHKRIFLDLGDKPEYFLKDLAIVYDFDIKTLDMERSYLSYTLMGENSSDEHVLDTVYSDEYEMDQVWNEIETKLVTYKQEIHEVKEEDPELIVDFKGVMDRLTYLTEMPAESEYYLFDFYYVQCPPCLKSVPYVKKLRENFSKEKLSIISINPYDTKEKINDYLSKTNVTYSSAMIDLNYVKDSIGQIPYPTFILFDKSGKKLWYFSGFDEQLVENVSQFIKKE